MLKFLRSMFAWQNVVEPEPRDLWQYQENTVTGQRRAIYIGSCGYQPIRANWLRRGDVLIDRWGVRHISTGYQR